MWAIQKGLDGGLFEEYQYLASLDFKNAFNTIDRREVAKGLRKYAPGLYQAVRWAYGDPSDLLIRTGPATYCKISIIPGRPARRPTRPTPLLRWHPNAAQQSQP